MMPLSSSGPSRELERDIVGRDAGRSALGNCSSVHDYQKIGRVGEGTYGYVYKAVHRKTKEIVALKRIILHNEESDGFPLTSIREIRALQLCLGHPNVVQLHDVVVGMSRDAVFLLFEYCEHDLAAITEKSPGVFKESECKTLATQLLAALEFLHGKWIAHRDIKPSNLLYCNGRLKLADFGLARTMSRPAPRDLTPTVSTLWYRAPEVLLGSSFYDCSVDIWSAGCVFAELLIQRPIFSGNSELEQLQSIFRVLGAPNVRIWPEMSEFALIKQGAVDFRAEQRQYPFNCIVDVLPRVSAEGVTLFNALFTYRPQSRVTAREAQEFEYFRVRPLPASVDFMPSFPEYHRFSK